MKRSETSIKRRRKPGHPRVGVNDDQARQIEILAGYGLTIPQTAAVIGIAESTLRLRKVDDAKVTSAFTRGRAKAEAIIGEALFRQAKGGDVSAIKWWEITRAGRRETSRAELTGKDGAPLPPTAITVTIVKPDADG